VLFTITMNKKRIYLYSGLLILVFIAWLSSDSSEVLKEESEVAKIALREIGHQLLLANQDTSSLVLPIISLEASKYKLSFQKQLSIEPDSLVSMYK